MGSPLLYLTAFFLRTWATSVSESSVLRFFKQGSKCIVIKLAFDGKICCVFLLMFGYNGKKPTQGPSLICLLPYSTDVTDGGFYLVDVVYGFCQWDTALDQSAFFDVSVLTCIFFLLHILSRFMTSMGRLQQYAYSIIVEL